MSTRPEGFLNLYKILLHETLRSVGYAKLLLQNLSSGSQIDN